MDPLWMLLAGLVVTQVGEAHSARPPFARSQVTSSQVTSSQTVSSQATRSQATTPQSAAAGSTGPRNFTPGGKQSSPSQGPTFSAAQQLVGKLFDPPARAPQSDRGQTEAAQPLALREALQRATSRSRQIQAAKAYWALAAARATVAQRQRELVALEQLNRLAQPNRPLTEQDRRAWQAALAGVAAALTEAKLQAEQVNWELNKLIGFRAQQAIIPTDLPHAGGYDTKIQKVYPSRPPAKARFLHQILPVRYAGVLAHAEAVWAAEDYLAAARRDYQAGTAQLVEALESTREVGRHQRAFITALLRYNQAIAEYALPIAQGRLSAEVLANMLISSASATNATLTTEQLTNLRSGIRSRVRGRTRTTSHQVGRVPADGRRSGSKDAASSPLSRGKFISFSLPESPGDSAATSPEAALSGGPQAVEVVLQTLQQSVGQATRDPATRVRLQELPRSVVAGVDLKKLYWEAWRQAALVSWREQVCQELEQLTEDLFHRESAWGASGGVSDRALLMIRAQQAEAQARCQNQRLHLLLARCRLTVAAGRSLSQPWLWPIDQPTVRRSAGEQRHVRLLQQRAVAVATANQAWQVYWDSRRGQQPPTAKSVAQAISALHWQAHQLRSFLETLEQVPLSSQTSRRGPPRRS